jgi:hypothetical protein
VAHFELVEGSAKGPRTGVACIDALRPELDRDIRPTAPSERQDSAGSGFPKLSLEADLVGTDA